MPYLSFLKIYTLYFLLGALSLALNFQGFASELPADFNQEERNRIQRNLDSGQFDLQSINKPELWIR